MSSFTLNDGHTIPAIAFGTGTALYKQDAEKAVVAALREGCLHIDAAQLYDNEESVGNALKTFFSSDNAPPRESIYVTTKFAKIESDQTVEDVLKISLKKLQLDYVDLYLIHTPIPFEDRLPEIWKQLEDAHKAGLARSIGVSNFRPRDLDAVLSKASIKPAVNQIELHTHIWNAPVTQEIFKVQDANKIRTASYGGINPLFKISPNPLEGVAQSYRKNHSLPSTVTDAQIVHKWLIQRGVIVVTTSSKPERVRIALEAHKLPDLSEDELTSFEKADGGRTQRFFMKHMDE